MKNITFLIHVVFVMLFVASSPALTTASFPETEIVLEMATLSHAVYHLRKKVLSCHSLIQNVTDKSNNGTPELPSDIFQRLLPNETSCLYYNHDYSLGRQVLIVRNAQRNYIAIAYSGTDDWRTALSDGNILSKAFGPSSAEYGNNISSIFDTVPSTVRVHSGFNNDVFSNAGFSTVLNCILSAREGGNCDNNDVHVNNNIIQPSQPYKIYTTGHSLGAASSVILGAALHLAFPSEEIQSINYGSPKIGNFEWSSWIDSLQPNYNSSESAIGEETADQRHHGTFESFRFVNKIDLVPRLPDVLYFQHAGHTLQMSAGGTVRAYYDHIGNGDLGFAGVPYGWNAAAYVFIPSAIASHMMLHYLDYLQYYKPKTRTSYAVEFEIIDNSTGSDNENNPPGPDDEAYLIE